MRITIEGDLGDGVTSKDIILHIIGVIGTAGGTGSVIEFAGDAIKKLSMEARMSISNMAIEAGARAGIIAPDDITFEYLKGRPMAPRGEQWDQAVAYWKSLVSDDDAKYDKEIIIKAADIEPTVTWGDLSSRCGSYFWHRSRSQGRRRSQARSSNGTGLIIHGADSWDKDGRCRRG